jgi:hypothetical protein
VVIFAVKLTITPYKLRGQFDYELRLSPSSSSDGTRTDLKQSREFSNATAFLIPHTRHLGAALRRYDILPTAYE